MQLLLRIEDISCFLRNVRLLLKDMKKKCATASEKKMCAAASERYFLFLSKCMAASENILCFFKERATASEKILRGFYTRPNFRSTLSDF